MRFASTFWIPKYDISVTYEHHGKQNSSNAPLEFQIPLVRVVQNLTTVDAQPAAGGDIASQWSQVAAEPLLALPSSRFADSGTRKLFPVSTDRG
jgi:hypothetical protein